jgi:hypothetical protein
VPHGSTDKVAELKQLVQQDAPDPAAAADAHKQQRKGKKQDSKQQEKQQHDPQQAAQQLAAVLGVDGRAAQQLLEQEPGLGSIGQKQLKVRWGKCMTGFLSAVGLCLLSCDMLKILGTFEGRAAAAGATNQDLPASGQRQLRVSCSCLLTLLLVPQVPEVVIAKPCRACIHEQLLQQEPRQSPLVRSS